MNPETGEQSAEKKSTRLDHRVIISLVPKGSKVLDLGCGDGTLLSKLIEQRNCRGTGIEIDENAIYQCMARGLSVSHGDIDTGLSDYSDKRFDYVILNESVQQVLHPQKVILESLRVGKRVIVGVPNFCHIRSRLQIFFKGKVPITRELPDEWFDTPNLRFLSLKDFRNFCAKNSIKIINEVGISRSHIVRVFTNLFAIMGVFVLEK